MASKGHNELTSLCIVLLLDLVLLLLLHHFQQNLIITGSDNGLSPGRRQAIIWTNAGILLIEPLGTNFSEILIEILTFSLKKMHLKVLSAKWRPFYPGLNVLKTFPKWLKERQSSSNYCIKINKSHNISRFHLQVPHLQLNCSDLTSW